MTRVSMLEVLMGWSIISIQVPKQQRFQIGQAAGPTIEGRTIFTSNASASQARITKCSAMAYATTSEEPLARVDCPKSEASLHPPHVDPKHPSTRPMWIAQNPKHPSTRPMWIAQNPKHPSTRPMWIRSIPPPAPCGLPKIPSIPLPRPCGLPKIRSIPLPAPCGLPKVPFGSLFLFYAPSLAKV